MIVGYLTSDLTTSYNCTMWSGLRRVCLDNRAGLLYFSGGALKSPDINQSSRNLIYDLVSSKNVDGILINSATIFHYLDAPEIERFYEKYAALPIVSIGVKIGRWPAVLTDNAGGVRETVSHLIHHHQYRSIAYIGGPENNLEARIRLNAYKQAMTAFGQALDEQKIVYGSYSISSGAESLDVLRSRNQKIDAVITANDDMAIGVMNRAHSLGIVVPNELAICGFDDIAEAPMLSVPLSTARQPFLRQAETACRLLIDCIKDRREHDDIVLETEFIRRRSCGCLSDAVKRAEYIPTVYTMSIAPTDPNSCVETLRKRRASILAGLHASPENRQPEFEAAGAVLFDSLVTYLETEGSDKSLDPVDRLFNRALINNFVDFPQMQNTISELLRTTGRYLFCNRKCSEIAQSYWQQVRILLQETSFYSQSFTKMQAEYHTALLRRVNGKLVRSFDLGQLLKTIRNELPSLDIRACYLSLYEPYDDTYETSRLILAYNESGEIALPQDGIVFKTRDLIPREVLSLEDPDALIIEGLFFEGEQFGYIFFKTNPEKIVFDELRGQISSAIKGALLTQAVQELAMEQADHAEQLQEALDTLKRNQEKMILSEKMASLGRLTAGIAHEMNTPLATVRMAAMELQGSIQEYRQSIGDEEVTPSDHRAISDEMFTASELIRKSAERAQSFVQGVKSQTRDLKSTDRHTFDVIPVVKEAVLLLNHTIRKNNCPVNITHGDDRLMVHGTEGRLSQVVTNLVLNALDASKGKEGCYVDIGLTREDGNIVITVQDRGSGIDKENLSRIFDPLFTTKSLAEGTGLGLTIVHDIVHGDFGGRIDVSSRLGEGTTFKITLPEKSGGWDDAQKISN